MTEPPSYIPPTVADLAGYRPPTTLDRAFDRLDALPLPLLMLAALIAATVVVIGGAILLILALSATAPTQHHPCMEVYQQMTGMLKVYCER